MKKLLLGVLPLYLLLGACASTSITSAGRSFTIPIDEHTVWRVHIQRLEVGLDDTSKAVVEIKNELDRSITVEFGSTLSHYSPLVGDFSSIKIEVDKGTYDLRPSGPSLGSIPAQVTYSFEGGSLYKMTWSRSHEKVSPR